MVSCAGRASRKPRNTACGSHLALMRRSCHCAWEKHQSVVATMKLTRPHSSMVRWMRRRLGRERSRAILKHAENTVAKGSANNKEDFLNRKQQRRLRGYLSEETVWAPSEFMLHAECVPFRLWCSCSHVLSDSLEFLPGWKRKES